MKKWEKGKHEMQEKHNNIDAGYFSTCNRNCKRK